MADSTTPTAGSDTGTGTGADAGFDHEAFVESLVRTMAMTTGPASPLNLITLVASGLMTWGPQNKAPLSYEQARVEAAALVLKGVTGVMIAITDMTLDGNGTDS